MAADTGTIFDSAWFAFERPWFKKIAAQSDHVLTLLLIGLAVFALIIALQKRSTALKAVVFAWFVLP